jgi:ABC-2 type transport system permease protein
LRATLRATRLRATLRATRLRATLRATPTLFRVGWAEALAYRAELLVWILATTMPLVMMALFSAVAREAPIGGLREPEIVAYFLATFIVRQLTGSWAAWQINMEVRQGTLAGKLLRPIDPLYAYAVEQLAAIPLRVLLAVPLAAAALVATSGGRLPRTPSLWFSFGISIALGWAITFLMNAALGILSLWLESSMKLVDLYLVLFFVFSGYLVPITLFPGWLRAVADLLPFRFQIGLPVEILIGLQSDPAPALLRQAAWTAGLVVLTVLLFRRGLRRFAAYGG